ncbi:MauE/DoxX family redox-associated membrane protein [Derxia gummosa]|uniref:Methylamine utilization protein MauE n=1 Tax=Derxia gummosa DSM 723 TaxID=1121388 RepID=A0A8B6X7F5_9BURK|nr:MauE/DoxX family redox-associated membrane protein [Derxia gummosa]
MPALDPVVAGCAATGLALVLLTGAVHKLVDRDAFARTVAEHQLLPDALVAPAALALPAAEIAAGAALCLDGARPAGLLAAVALLALYTGALVLNLLRGHVEIDCGCGWGRHAGRGARLTWALPLRNFALLALAGVAALPVAARDTVWIDSLTVVAGGGLLLALHLTAHQLLVNQPRLAALRRPS